jgi:hypothetical protein
VSLVFPEHVEGTRDRNNCHYQMVPKPGGGLTMGMSLWYGQQDGLRCKECFFKPFFHSGKCPKCGGELEKESG